MKRRRHGKVGVKMSVMSYKPKQCQRLPTITRYWGRRMELILHQSPQEELAPRSQSPQEEPAPKFAGTFISDF